jgi:hypothetical protein
LQAQIQGTGDVNKGSYLKAIADRLVTSPGFPADWGTSEVAPADLGLALANSVDSYTLDVDKISRLNSLNRFSLSHLELTTASKLGSIALGVSVSQVMAVSLSQTVNSTVGGITWVDFDVLTTVDLKPVTSTLQGYIVADDYLGSFDASIESGNGHLTVSYPSSQSNPLMVVFARASFDERVTSYAIYNFASSTQQYSPSADVLEFYPLNYALHYNSSEGTSIQDAYVLSYHYEQPLSSSGASEYTIPRLLDSSPFVLVASGQDGGSNFVAWTAYPQVPLQAGSSFAGSERNVYSYMVTVNGVFYKLDISLGDIA